MAEFIAAAGVKVTVGSGLISGESCIVGVGDEAGIVEKDVGLARVQAGRRMARLNQTNPDRSILT